jgi:ribosomal protein S18 acetylase RimI-like enzyme
LLLEAVAEEAQRLGANKVLLSVAAANASAQKFFGRMGFRTTMNEMMLVIGN